MNGNRCGYVKQLAERSLSNVRGYYNTVFRAVLAAAVEAAWIGRLPRTTECN